MQLVFSKKKLRHLRGHEKQAQSNNIFLNIINVDPTLKSWGMCKKIYFPMWLWQVILKYCLHQVPMNMHLQEQEDRPVPWCAP